MNRLLQVTLAALLLSATALQAAAGERPPQSSEAPRLRPAAGPVAPPASAVDDDPFAAVWLVTSRALYDGGIAAHARKAAALHDSVGNALVIAQARTWQLPEISRGIHERERHCGGYFAFASRAEAEAFLRNEQTAKALRAKALADYTIDNAATVAPWLPQVREARILDTIKRLSTDWPNRYYASSHGTGAARWIRDTWQALAQGRDDASVELFTDCGNCGGQPSVILTVRGSEWPDEVVVVGGHLDSISNSSSGNTMIAPGADDDASGIATITEIIRIALADGWRPKRTLKFMGYAAEEVGLRGSNAIAQSFRVRGVDVVGVLQLDMTNYGMGHPYAMRLMTDNSNAGLQGFVTRLFDTYLAPLGLARGTDTCGYACSDHASWTAAGYPAAMMAEPVFFDRLHTIDDTLAHMGNRAEVSVNFAKLGLAFVGELGKTHVPPPRRRNGAQPLVRGNVAGAAVPAPARTRSPAPSPAAASPAPRTAPPTSVRGAPATLLAPLLQLRPRRNDDEDTAER